MTHPEIEAVLRGESRWCVIQGDCLDYLDAVRGRIGMVLSDPPYGMAHETNYAERGRAILAPNKNFMPVHGDDKPYDPAPILALGVPACLWGGNWFADKLPPSSGWLVWDKERPDDLDQATCELAWTNYVKGVRRLKHLWHGMIKASERGESYHPTQKPVELMRWVLSLRWTPKGDIVVFDPYCGSGPVGVAAVQMGYRYVGVEYEASYCAIARRRIADAAAQGSLF